MTPDFFQQTDLQSGAALADACVSFYERDPASREADLRIFRENLSASGVRVSGKEIRGLLIPKFFSEKQTALLKEAGETMARICEKAVRFFFESAAFRSCYAYPPKVEELILTDPGYTPVLPMLRVDLFYDEVKDDFRLCELNTDGSSGMIEDAELGRIFRETELYRCLLTRIGIRPFELFDTLAKRYLSIFSGSGKRKEAPNVAVVDFLEKASSLDEFERYRRAFEKLGAPARIIDVRDLTCRDGILSTADGWQIDLIYRRAVTSDLLADPEAGCALLSAAKAEHVCLMGSFATQIVHDKAFFPSLLKFGNAFLTEEEQCFVRDHLPVTVALTPKEIESRSIRTEKDRWVLKPRDSYGSRGVYLGPETEAEEWERLLDTFCEADYLAQEYVEPFSTKAVLPKTGRSVRIFHTTGIYVIGGKMTGLYSRASEQKIISTGTGGYDLASLVYSGS